jgi:integrase
VLVRTVNRELATLRRLLRLAHEWKILYRVPRIHLLRGEHQREFVLSHQQETLFLAAAEARGDLRDMAIVPIDTGLRIGECLTLEWTDARLEPAEGAQHGYLTVRRKNAKNSKSRNVPLTARVVEVLRRRDPSSTGLVFHRADGLPLYQTWLNEQQAELRRLFEAASRFRVAFLPTHVRHTAGRDWSRCVYYHEADGPQLGYGVATVRSPFSRGDGNAVTRLEAWNGARLLGVGTNLGTVNEREFKKNQQVV